MCVPGSVHHQRPARNLRSNQHRPELALASCNRFDQASMPREVQPPRNSFCQVLLVHRGIDRPLRKQIASASAAPSCLADTVLVRMADPVVSSSQCEHEMASQRAISKYNLQLVFQHKGRWWSRSLIIHTIRMMTIIVVFAQHGCRHKCITRNYL